MSIVSKNPATEIVIQQFSSLSNRQIKSNLDQAEHTFSAWSRTPFRLRRQLMEQLAKLLKKRQQELATTITQEMGKPITQSVAEIEKCILTCRYYAKQAQQFLSTEHIVTDARESYVRFDPLGVILAIMPWNFPFWQVIRFAAPTLMAGNVGLLKHASNVPQCGLALQTLFIDAGFPGGVFQNLLIESDQVAAVIRDDRVTAVTLTGSEQAGSSVAKIAGEVIKKTILELGGSDPFIILKDADLMKAATVGVTARTLNAGQSCIAAKRFIVLANVFDEFLGNFQSRLALLKVGDPMKKETDIGPLATKSILMTVQRQVGESVKKGAKVVVGGMPLKRTGYFYPPTVLINVKPGMPAYDEEIFGPVASVIKVSDEDEAIRVANDTAFGLGASVWTRNISRAKEYASQIEAGAVFINGMVKSDPRLPFGGIKKSGYGRELGSYGIKEFVNVKTVWIDK